MSSWMHIFSLLVEQSPKCPRCGIRTAWLKEIPVSGKIILVCRKCKKAFMKKTGISHGALNKILARIKKNKQ